MTDAGTEGRGRRLALWAAILGWMFDGFEMGLFPLVARPSLRELLGPEGTAGLGSWISWVFAAFLLGAAAGGMLFGWLGDRIGRVRAMTWSVFTYAVFSGAGAFVDAPWQLALLRFVAALGMGGEWSLGVALVMEVWPSASRPRLAATIGAAANVGFLLVALAGLAIGKVVGAIGDGFRLLGAGEGDVAWLLGREGSGWRILMLVSAAPALLTFFIRTCVPESAAWREAASGAPRVRLRDIFARGIGRTTMIATGLAAVALVGMWGSTQWLPTFAGKLAGPEVRDASAWTQVVSALGLIAGSAVAAFVASAAGRRASYALFCAASLVATAAVFRLPIRYGPAFLGLVAAVAAATASFFGWLPLYLPELFPTRIRATAQGFAFNAGRVIAAAGTLATGRLVDAFGEDYARVGAVTSLVYAAGLVIVWWSPETKGRPLPP